MNELLLLDQVRREALVNSRLLLTPCENIVRVLDWFEDSKFVYFVQVRSGVSVTTLRYLLLNFLPQIVPAHADPNSPAFRSAPPPALQEYAQGGDLFDVSQRYPRRLVPELITRQIVFQVVAGVAHCHRCGVIHRDVKPENIVITVQGVVKLCDFGLSIDCAEERPISRLGTLEFMAPELVAITETSKQSAERRALEGPALLSEYDFKVI